MKCKLVELFVEGIRLDREAAKSSNPITGDLTISDNFYENASGRALRVADLMDMAPGYTRPLLRPLFDPVIIRMKAGNQGFVLRGWQIEAKTVDGESTVREIAQEWWVRPD